MALLRGVRECALGLQSTLAGAGPPLRIGRRYSPSEASGKSPHDAELRGIVGRDPLGEKRAPLPRVPGRVTRRVASSTRPDVARLPVERAVQQEGPRVQQGRYGLEPIHDGSLEPAARTHEQVQFYFH